MGFGTVKKYNDSKQGTSYFRFIVSDMQGIFRLIQIFNGQLRLYKTRKRYAEWCDTFFKRPKVQQNGLLLDLVEHDRVCSLDDA